MSRHEFQISLKFPHRIVFTRDALAPGNRLVADLLQEHGGGRVLALVEDAVAEAWPGLRAQAENYFADLGFDWRGIHILEGGEAVKNDDALVREVWERIDRERIDRHSFVLAIGGGAFLDAVGFGVATAHRGVRLVRFPTTTLAQDDSGVGVKCAINAFGKKNWVGSFSVPYAVVNDFRFLETQSADTRRAGLIEAVKVALVKDRDFFNWIWRHGEELAALEPGPFEVCVERSALAHARHIAEGGDPFETGSSRPLDFGHWAAHKLEQLSGFELSHARAVAIGVALDTLYSARCGLLREAEAERALEVLDALGLRLWDETLELRDAAGRRRVHEGLEEFREHLGGELTILLLKELGEGQEVHALDEGLVDACIDDLRRRARLARPSWRAPQ
jgi:3-dehydroquinate synthase